MTSSLSHVILELRSQPVLLIPESQVIKAIKPQHTVFHVAVLGLAGITNWLSLCFHIRKYGSEMGRGHGSYELE